MKRIDLNVDIGEGFPHDRDLLRFATSANICCGEHAGSWELTKETIQLCLESGTRIGMHPGYPDREGMGRRAMSPELAPAYGASIQDQVDRFYLFVPTSYLKPHGALYNDATGTGRVSDSARAMIGAACERYRLPLMGLPGTRLETVALATKLPFIREGFADRAFLPDGTLVPRTEPGAVLHDRAAIRRQVLEIAPRVDSICLHGDTPGCVDFAEMVFATLAEAGYEVGA